MTTRRFVSAKETAWGIEVACDAGQRDKPVGCERHRDHYYCVTCVGWYGVPHDRIHTGDGKHPRWDIQHCACRPCRDAKATKAKS